MASQRPRLPIVYLEDQDPDVVVFRLEGRRWPVHRNLLRACKVEEKGGGLWGLSQEASAGGRLAREPRLTRRAEAEVRRVLRGSSSG